MSGHAALLCMRRRRARLHRLLRRAVPLRLSSGEGPAYTAAVRRARAMQKRRALIVRATAVHRTQNNPARAH
eukprot:5884483-Alexandrium_andersonii.AAC.1